MNSLQQFLIKFKKNGSDKPTHTIIPDKNSKLPEIKFGSSLTVKQEDIEEPFFLNLIKNCCNEFIYIRLYIFSFIYFQILIFTYEILYF